jgi:UDP-N-acetylmuramyl pentapeptide synthase
MLLGKTLRFLLRRIRRGGGSALPGTLAAKIQPKLLDNAIQSAPLGIAVVSGTAGKSSTTKLLVELLRAHGLRVFTNPSTANIKQGFFAAVLQFGDLLGRIDADVVVMEWDEGHGAAMAEVVRPKVSVLTNVLSDQLDRFVDPVHVQQKLAEIAKFSQLVVANRDDNNITQIVHQHPNVMGFGLDSSLQETSPKYAINFGPNEEISAHCIVLAATAERLLIRLNGHEIEIAGDYSNLTSALNAAGAIAGANQFVELDLERVVSTIEATPPVFARDELAKIRDRFVRLMLVQNPTSFQLNIDKLSPVPSPLMLMAGHDIHDPSWLWTVDFSRLSKVDIVSGFNAWELALCLKFQGVQVDLVEPRIDAANERFASLEGETPTIVFSADAMRRTRRYLGLAK